MDTEHWMTAIAAAGGFIAWMTALWIRAGRILQRIDDLVGDQRTLRTRVEQHETRLTRLEVFAERNR